MSRLIVVCLKQALSIDVPLRLSPDGRRPRTEEVVRQPDRAARAALALALRLAAAEDRVLALAVAPAAGEAPLREAVALGCAEALRVWHPLWPQEPWADGSDGSATHTRFCARAAAAVLRARQPALVLTGEQSQDGGHGVFAGVLAAELGADLALRCVGLEGEGSRWAARVKLERGYTQGLTLNPPAVVSVAGNLPPPSRARLPAWIAAQCAAIALVSPELPYPVLPRTQWRAPVPRVRRIAYPAAGQDAESRIAAMMAQPTGTGGTLIPAEAGPAAQADAFVQRVRGRQE